VPVKTFWKSVKDMDKRLWLSFWATCICVDWLIQSWKANSILIKNKASFASSFLSNAIHFIGLHVCMCMWTVRGTTVVFIWKTLVVLSRTLYTKLFHVILGRNSEFMTITWRFKSTTKWLTCCGTCVSMCIQVGYVIEYNAALWNTFVETTVSRDNLMISSNERWLEHYCRCAKFDVAEQTLKVNLYEMRHMES